MSRAALIARGIAILIALFAFIDPALPISRAVPPVVALLGDSAARGEIERQIGGDYQVVNGPLPAAAGTIVAGQSLPRSVSHSASPVFASAAPKGVWIDTIIAPAIVSMESRGELTVLAGTASPGQIEASLSMAGTRLATSHQAVSNSAVSRLTLPFVPLSNQPTQLDVTVRAGDDSARASVVVDVSDRRWPVLFYDPRPSWLSTFVRRSIEADPRFVVGGRVNTSRLIATAVQGSPRSLSDPSLIELYDAIAVGAPNQLTDADVSGLENFLRRRGGSVVLLFDEPPTLDSPIARLLAVRRWSNEAPQDPIAIRARGDSVALRATELSTPSSLPGDAAPLAFGDNRPAVWSLQAGAGEIVVNGALDAWRFRDPSSSAFDAFWRETIAGSAARALPPVLASLQSTVVAPRARTNLDITVRDAVLSSGTVPVTASATIDDSIAITLWPAGVGRLIARFRAPAAPGLHQITIVANGNREHIPFAVDSTVSLATPDERELIRGWADATGGKVVASQTLKSTLNATIPRAERVETLHVFRSAWWILPFALLLAFEWWWRRRIGNS